MSVLEKIQKLFKPKASPIQDDSINMASIGTPMDPLINSGG